MEGSAGVNDLDDMGSGDKTKSGSCSDNSLDEGGAACSYRQIRKVDWAETLLKSQCKGSGEGHKTVEVVKKGLPSVAYGCISIADEPGMTLVRGSLLMKPYGKITQFPFYDLLRNGFNEMEIGEMNVLQRSVAPHILRGDDCFISGGKRCGKTLSYLLPIIGSLVETYEEPDAAKENQQQFDEKGPFCIIVCFDSAAVMKIVDYLYYFLHSLTNHKLIYGAVLRNDRDSRRRLDLGIDILVTTVSQAAELCKKTGYFSFEKLKFLIFDDIDVTLRSAKADFEKVHTASINFVLKHPKRAHYQRIFCAHEWSYEVERLYFKIPGLPNPTIPAIPVVFIQSRNQAIRYSRMELQFHHMPNELKIQRIMALLHPGSSLDSMTYKHVLIVCSTPNVAFSVHQQLEARKVRVNLAIMETLTKDDVADILQRWEDVNVSERRIMVVHDGILKVKGLPMHNVTCLIHYDLPTTPDSGKSSAGAERFSTMWGFFRDITDIKLNDRSMVDIPTLISHFLLTGTEKELCKLKHFGAKLDAKMPESLSTIADEMGQALMESRKFCPGIELYGRCVELDSYKCLFRHDLTLSELNDTPFLPRSGEVEVRITKCYNPSQYFGQILRYYELKNGMKYLRNSYINRFKKRTEQLTAYYDDEENWVPLESFDSGTVCGVQMVNDDNFTRAKIETVVTRDYGNYPKTVKIFCLDTGEFRHVQAEKLWTLPEEFVNLNSLSVRIILAHLQPFRGASDYTAQQIHLANDLSLDKILNGRIRFSLGNTVWVDPLVEMNLDTATKKAVKGCSLRAEILRQHVADNNDLHMKQVLDLCRKTGFSCPEFESEDWASDPSFMNRFFKHDNMTADWAFMDSSSLNDPKPVEIWANLVKNPSFIFGNMDKFDKLLDRLNEDLHRAVEEIIKDFFPNYNNQFVNFFETDLVVSAKDTVNEKWRRAIITEKSQGDTEAETVFEVFFADIGDRRSGISAKEIFPIPVELVNRLPFQAIHLKLDHIEPVETPFGEGNNSGNWNNETIAKLQSLLLDENDASLQMDVVAFKSNTTNTPCRSYSAMFFDKKGEEAGCQLVSQGAARFSPGGEEKVTTIRNKLLARYNRMYDERERTAEAPDNQVQVRINEDELDNEIDFFDGWDMSGLHLFAREVGILPRETKNGYKTKFN